MKRIYIVTVFFCLAATAKAQFVYDYLKAGDDYFAGADYASAASYYEKYLGKESKTEKQEYNPYKPQSTDKKKATAITSREKALWQLAESYRHLHYPSKAVEAYQQLLQVTSPNYLLVAFYLSGQLRELGKLEEAEAGFTSFLNSYPHSDGYKIAAEKELANLRFIKSELSKPGLQYFEVSKEQGAMSSAGANYAPVWLDSVTLLFTSTRALDNPNASPAANHLLQTQLQQSPIAEAVTEFKSVKGVEQGAASVSADGSTLYFTRWKTTGNKDAMIFYSVKSNGKWDEPRPLSAAINMAGFNTQQPFVTRDNKYLFFSSNRPGGQGGLDIWYVPVDQLESNTTPVNAGSLINSVDDEQAPYYDADSSLLIFSSNGRVGMGGFDLFSADGKPGSFGAPVNLGYPINSFKDDLYFAKRINDARTATEIWLSSDRSAACCLELFRIVQHKPAPVPEVVPERIVTIAPPTPDTVKSEVLENVYYAYDKAQLLEGSEQSLNKLVAMLNEHKSMIIEIGGHTDSKGGEAYNQRLSLARAQSCVSYIVSKGVSPERVRAKGYGASKPVAPNTNPDGSDNPEGRELNRRTEFTILQQ